VASWALYDLANTIFSMNVISLYLSLWVVKVMGGTDAQFGYATSISMAVIFVFSPFIGALSDQAPRRMPFLVFSNLACVAFTVMLARFDVRTTLLLFIFANIAYQATHQFYDSLLPEVSGPHNRGRIGGIGLGVGYWGSFVGIGTGLLVLGGIDTLPTALQTARYARVFQATGVLFLLFSIPCFLFVRERTRAGRRVRPLDPLAAVRQVAKTLGSRGEHPGLFRFLIGRAFYTDAVNTLISFMGIYVVMEVGFSTVQAQLVLAVGVCFASLGGFVWGRVTDRIGPKRALDIILVVWMAVLAWTAAVGFFRLPQAAFWPVPIIAGFALGGTWASDRPLMLRLTPPGRVGEFYGLYGMVGRFSAITGPFLWGFVVNYLGWGRPSAVLILLALVLTAWLILRPVSDRTGRK